MVIVVLIAHAGTIRTTNPFYPHPSAPPADLKKKRNQADFVKKRKKKSKRAAKEIILSITTKPFFCWSMWVDVIYEFHAIGTQKLETCGGNTANTATLLLSEECSFILFCMDFFTGSSGQWAYLQVSR